MSLPATIAKISKPQTVRRRSELTFSGLRPDAQTEVTNTVSIACQRVTDKPVTLERMADGDDTQGEIRVWVTSAALAAATIPWTELRIAPPEKTAGPPGDEIEYDGRLYEITERLGWTEGLSFTGDPGFQRYVAAQRGAA